MKKKAILLSLTSILILFFIIKFYKGINNMNVFNHSKASFEEILSIEKDKNNNNFQYRKKIATEENRKVEINFYGINPPEKSRISLYSESLRHIIYIGEYNEQINVDIPISIYNKEKGLDAIKFSIYNYDTGDTYVLEQEKPYMFWKKDTIVNVHFLPKRDYYNEEFGLFVGYIVTLDDIKNN